MLVHRWLGEIDRRMAWQLRAAQSSAKTVSCEREGCGQKETGRSFCQRAPRAGMRLLGRCLARAHALPTVQHEARARGARPRVRAHICALSQGLHAERAVQNVWWVGGSGWGSPPSRNWLRHRGLSRPLARRAKCRRAPDAARRTQGSNPAAGSAKREGQTLCIVNYKRTCLDEKIFSGGGMNAMGVVRIGVGVHTGGCAHRPFCRCCTTQGRARPPHGGRARRHRGAAARARPRGGM